MRGEKLEARKGSKNRTPVFDGVGDDAFVDVQAGKRSPVGQRTRGVDSVPN